MQKSLEPWQAEQTGNVNLLDLIEQPAWKTILIDLVKTEKMNPWSIDLVELANKYFEKIQAMDHSDLKLPANAILASAILLKMKAKTIKISSIEDDEEATREITPEEKQLLEANVPGLRHGRQFRQGKISLDELVASIESILEKTKHKGNILREKEIPEFSLVFNQQDIEEKIGKVWQLIREKADSQGFVRFSHLLEEKNPVETVNVFIPMLFLTNQGKINIWQEEFWREIFISLVKS